MLKYAKANIAGSIGGSLALCCSIPFGVVGLLVSTVVKVSIALCKSVVQVHRKNIIEKGNEMIFSEEIRDGMDVERAPVMLSAVPQEIEEMEKKLRSNFPGTGFWQFPLRVIVTSDVFII